MLRTSITFMALISLCGISLGAVIYVPDDYTTIQTAIDAAIDGDTVIVRPGTYYGKIDFGGRAIEVRSERGSEVTIIDGMQSGSVILFESQEGNDSIITGFTITNGTGSIGPWTATTGGGIYCYTDSSPTIAGNIITGNTADGGGGISCYSSSSPIIINNIIHDNWINYVNGSGAAILCADFSAPVICNNTIVNNRAESGVGGGISSQEQSSPIVCNTILWDNHASNGPEIYVGNSKYTSTLTISHSDVKNGRQSVFVNPINGNLVWDDQSMIDACPLFVEGAVNDYHLTYHSPCRDAGDGMAAGLPAEDFEGDPRIAVGLPDMGADEFHPHLYHAGTFTSGGFVDFRIIGTPYDNPVALGLGSGIQDPPQATPYGDLHLQLPLLGKWTFDFIPSSGVLVFPMALPVGLVPGDEYPFQALIGPLGDPNSILTNLMILTVE